MRVGFIGLGNMARPMSENILRAGHELVVAGQGRDETEELVLLGAEKAANGADAASRADVVITMLPDFSQVHETCLGEDGIIRTGTENTTVIDMSPIRPSQAKKIASALAGKGIEMLSCPVRGGEQGAADGTLSVVCGGKRETWDKYYDLLRSVASTVDYGGPIGAA